MNNKKLKLLPYMGWLITTVFVFFQFFLQTASSIMSEDWTRSFHLNPIQLSNLSAAFFYAYVLMQVPVGILYDHFKTKNVLVTAALTLAIGCFLLSTAHSYSLAIIARILMGIGSACGFVGFLKVIINNFPLRQFSFMLGIAETIGMILVTLGTILLSYLLLRYSWETAMQASGVVALLLAVLVGILIRDPVSANDSKPTFNLSDILKQLKLVVSNKQIILGSLYGFFIYSIITAFTSLWGFGFLTNTYGYTHTLAAKLISIVFIGLAVGSPTIGFLSKKYGDNKFLMVIAAICSAVVVSAIILIPGLPIYLMFILFFLGGFFCSGYVPCLTVIKDSVDNSIQATALAAANTLIMASAPVLQILIGALLESHFFGIATTNAINYRYSLIVFPLSSIIAIFISLRMSQPKLSINETILAP
jgi:MFS family permease